MAGGRVDWLDLAAVALSRARVEQHDAAQLAGQVVALDDVGPVIGQLELRRGVLRRRLTERVSGGRPGTDAAVEDCDAATMAEVVEHPPQPSGYRAAGIVVGHHEVA